MGLFYHRERRVFGWLLCLESYTESLGFTTGKGRKWTSRTAKQRKKKCFGNHRESNRDRFGVSQTNYPNWLHRRALFFMIATSTTSKESRHFIKTQENVFLKINTNPLRKVAKVSIDSHLATWLSLTRLFFVGVGRTFKWQTTKQKKGRTSIKLHFKYYFMRYLPYYFS